MGEAWQKCFKGGNLEGAYAGLAGERDYFAEAMKGRIASLLLKVELARGHFLASLRRSREAPVNLETISRLCLISAYATEHDLLVCGASNRLLKAASHRPDPGESSDRMRRALRQMDASQARVLLSLGKNSEAFGIFERIREEERGDGNVPEVLAIWTHGMAAATNGLGSSAEHHLEVAGLYCLHGSHRLHQARIAGLIAASWRFLGRREESQEWYRYLAQSGCTPATTAAIMARSALMVSRCQASGQLVSL